MKDLKNLAEKDSIRKSSEVIMMKLRDFNNVVPERWRIVNLKLLSKQETPELGLVAVHSCHFR